jgi:hypothetical protein
MNTTRLGRYLVLAALCAAVAPSVASAQKRQRDRINREEILGSPFVELDIYQVIRGLRPQFLETPKSPRSIGAGVYAELVVFQDERQQLDVNALRTISPRSIGEVRFFNPQQSVQRFGPKFNGGAILITTYKEPAGRDTTKPPR